MSTLRVSVESDHLEKLIKTPLVGLAELVWNALDADADLVEITTLSNDAGGPDGLRVTDNGQGMNHERAELDFKKLGGSWKTTVTATDLGRALHGKHGQGRWAAYGIGESVVWDSIAKKTASTEGELEQLRIAGRRSALNEFNLSESRPAAEGAKTGTTVTVHELTKRAEKDLLRTDAAEELTTTFALYLEQYPVKVIWDDTELDPSLLQLDRVDVPLDVEGVDDEIVLVIIEWNRSVPRALHLCDASGMSYTHIQPGIHAPGFQFTGYLTWDGFKEHHNDVMLGEMAAEPIPAILEAAKDAMRAYFKKRTGDRGTELIAAWKADETYPYKTEPTTPIEHAERDLFEIVAVASASAVEAAEPKSRALSLRLLREALETSPATLRNVLAEVLDLPADQLEELGTLLERTTLSSLIAAARTITDRLDFLAGLEEIVFDSELRTYVKERSQLHRIMAAETWVFREEYALTADDHTLTTALKAHVELLGREDLAPADLTAEVVDDEGSRMVVDLMLSKVIEQPDNRREHVVIELKRPTVHIGMDEFTQIQKYASAVAADARFEQTDTHWEFWIVGDSIKQPVLDMQIEGAPPGMIVKNAKFTLRAVTWASVIQDARHRLRFVQKSLDYQSSQERGMTYLQLTHEKYLPEAALPAEVSPGNIEAVVVE